MEGFAERYDQGERRVSSNKDVRAAAGGVYLNAPGGGVSGSGTAGTDITSELRQARQMLEEKLISDAEFEEIKSRFLSRL